MKDIDTLYRKKSNGRYEPVGYAGSFPDLSDGIWLVQNKEHSRSFQNLIWRLGEVKPFGDVVDDVSLIALEDELTQWFSAITDKDKDSIEYREFIEHTMAKDRAEIYNVSMSDLAMGVLNFLRKKLIKK